MDFLASSIDSFSWMQLRYISTVGLALTRRVLSVAVFAVLLIGVFMLFRVIPSSFLPEEDQGYFITIVQLPDGASKQRTDAVLSKIESYFLASPAIHSTDALSGQNFVFNTRGPNAATMFVPLKHWDERTAPQHHVKVYYRRGLRRICQDPRSAHSGVQCAFYSRPRCHWRLYSAASGSEQRGFQ
jgi:multidrug efflux pump subunit AcrB